jgi:hypothetical protein
VTRRERLERKLEKRADWEASALARSTRAFDAAHRLADSIPLGQPILVGHHSEKRARRDAERIHSSMSRGCEAADLAKHHASKAAGLEEQLARSVFSDDPDAVDAIEARILGLEAEREKMKSANAAYRKGGDAGLAAACGDAAVEEFAKLRRICPWEKRPFPSYALSNLGGNIGRLRKRIEEIGRRQGRAAAAEAAGGCLIAGAADYVNVTFSEKPEREILDALKAAGFSWSGGSWCGYREKLPPAVLALAAESVKP